jgi:YbbR domain-containing protein
MDVSDINATVDISNISKTGTDTFAIKVTTSNDTSVEGFSPRSVELHLDEPFSKTISVEADYRGGTSDSDLLTIGKIVPSKKNVVISGPKDSVSKVAYAKAMVELNFISHSVYIENVDLDLYDTDGNKIDNSFIEIANGDDTVDVDVDVHMKKELPVVPKFLHGIYSDDALSLKLTPATVVVKGEVSAVKNLTEIFTETIDEKELDIKSNSFKVSLEKAPDVAFVGSDDECSIVASVKNYAEKNIYIPAESVVISNIPEGRAATIHEKGITITVCGIDSVVSQITAYDLSFEIRGDILNLGINPDIPVYVKLSNDELHNVYIRNPDQRADIELK